MAIRCILIGPPGAGKTTVGRLLADALECPLIDTDQMIAVAAGKSVSEIFIDDGEPRFRELEVEAVRQALDAQEGVVSLGGGAVMTPANEQLVRHSAAPVIFLDVTITSAAPRIGFNRDRPLLIGNPRASWLSLMEARRPVYTALADHVVSTDDRSPHEIAEEITPLIGVHL